MLVKTVSKKTVSLENSNCPKLGIVLKSLRQEVIETTKSKVSKPKRDVYNLFFVTSSDFVFKIVSRSLGLNSFTE